MSGALSAPLIGGKGEEAGTVRGEVWSQHLLNGLWWSDQLTGFIPVAKEIDEVCVCVLLNCWMKQDGSWCSVLVAPNSFFDVEWCCLTHTQQQHHTQHSTCTWRHIITNITHIKYLIQAWLYTIENAITRGTHTQTHNPLYWSVNIVIIYFYD